ncbi:IclR family transcriptional regulator [Kitasatospora misakiensis]|uniref:IclR family transcriptional regulator n=1 Tax=Kitasatospora misakiensis TaxID=67330 RepID=A0ABW0X3Y4_9ACTN
MAITSPATGERSVADRLLGILGAFDAKNRELTVSEISRRCGIPIATTHRMVAKLISWGALERTIEGRCTIGLWLWSQTARATRHFALHDVAMPHMLQLHDRTRTMVNLSVMDDLDGVWLESIWSNQECYSDSRAVGNRFPLHATASGMVLLAHADPATQERFFAGHPNSRDKFTASDAAELRKEFRQVKHQGFAVYEGELDDGVIAIAAPVRERNGNVIAALAANVCPISQEIPNRSRLVRAAAQRVSSALALLQA